MQKQLDLFDQKKQRLKELAPAGILFNPQLSQWLKIELTYTSNAIEGNTLSRAETALVVDKGQTVGHKSFVEHQEAINHAKAWTWLATIAQNSAYPITESELLDIQRLILSGIDDQNAGRYRSTPVRIAGSRVILPNSLNVPDLMSEFFTLLANSSDHPVNLAIEAHYRLVTIHPFTDGNGRTARLLMNALLLQQGYAPLLIQPEQRTQYLNTLEKAQLGGSQQPYYKLMYQALNQSFADIIQSIEGKQQSSKIDQTKLLKIGELAKLSDESVPTIRHWTRLGLLTSSDFSPGGYHLYEPNTVRKIQKIRHLQTDKRLTLEEIARQLA